MPVVNALPHTLGGHCGHDAAAPPSVGRETTPLRTGRVCSERLRRAMKVFIVSHRNASLAAH